MLVGRITELFQNESLHKFGQEYPMNKPVHSLTQYLRSNKDSTYINTSIVQDNKNFPQNNMFFWIAEQQLLKSPVLAGLQVVVAKRNFYLLKLYFKIFYQLEVLIPQALISFSRLTIFFFSPPTQGVYSSEVGPNQIRRHKLSSDFLQCTLSDAAQHILQKTTV